MKTYSRLLVALLLLILFVPQVGGDPPPENGKHIEYYGNGKKKLETHYKDGKIDGPFDSWHENGQKSAEAHFKDGMLDGLLTKWYENGQKQAEVHYKKGELDGLGTEWYEDGKKKMEIHFKDGKEVSRKEFKHERTEGDFEEAVKIRDAIKLLENGKKTSGIEGKKSSQPRTKLDLVEFLMKTSWSLAIEPKIYPDKKPQVMKFLSEDTVQMWWGEKVRWFPVSARTLRIKHRDWTRVVAFSPDFRSFELYVPHENNFVHGYRIEQ